ncbi:isoprenylcysteine carboxylmethyltransferase family protein (plasmid) [Halococcus dombrowskii]|uniref:Isoprenylcysteine carboxylmethyltransferase family protein n=1 Tax=Halococcus dombrowskii TaxID=179637 RepID=A0AAX3AUH5_HALDO|nr:isoprenylcysteine carboxylmethyltransferase family protein [Halococcus dombrowskii]UOO97261.1 isoprenylcysteine carboxylmethyltransferase family protein [Halococcus dombrowskii]
MYLFVFYAAVAVAMGPDILREIRRRRREDTETAEAHDKGSRRVIGITGGGGILVGVAAIYLLPSMTILWHSHIMFAVGIAVLLVGGAVRRYAVQTLDEYFTPTVKIHQNQQVIDTGPYRWVRHPSYTGGLLEYTGIGLVLSNWVSIVAIVGGLVIAYVYRIRIEERTLSEELGEPYQRFLDRTPYRLIPYVW